MTTQKSKAQLLEEFDQVFQTLLAYYESGPPRGVKVDQWDAHDVLAHFLYWHYSGAMGIALALTGGPTWRNPGSPDELNEAAQLLYKDETIPDLLTQLRQATARMVRVASGLDDLDAPVSIRPDGSQHTFGQRLELLTNHCRSHIEALQGAGG